MGREEDDKNIEEKLRQYRQNQDDKRARELHERIKEDVESGRITSLPPRKTAGLGRAPQLSL